MSFGWSKQWLKLVFTVLIFILPILSCNIVFSESTASVEPAASPGSQGSPSTKAPESTTSSSQEGMSCDENLGKIVFASDRRREGNRFHFDLFVANQDGSDLTSLTDDFDFDNYPAWSPDHCWVAFTSNRNDNDDEIYIVSMRDYQVTRVTNFPGDDRWATWSPEGSRIAFIHTAGEESYDLYVIDSDGTNLTRLTSTLEIEHDPEWSPKGDRIAFECSHSSDEEKYSGHNGICLIDPDGENYIHLTEASEWNYLYPTWSPDGSQIALIANLTGQLEIYVMNADGSDLEQITSWGWDEGHNPNDLSWSPDGSSLVYKDITWNAAKTGGNEELRILNLNTMERTWVTEHDDRDQNPDW
jgi:TolB protein